MLTFRFMTRACLAAVMFIAATSSIASAGSYLGLGIGTGPAINDQTDRLAPDGRSGRLLVGTRFGRFSAEGSVSGYSLLFDQSGGMIPFGDAYQASAALKASLPLGNNFELFGRGGLQHTWFRAKNSELDASGSGYLLGAGFEYRLNLILGQGSIFVDYQY
ncbi:MAG: OmpA-like transrane domain, partial [Deltaproteobacteria bacterium]|nr:OmpA-like transrane domain [Deltaproteobacteria bacterium]